MNIRHDSLRTRRMEFLRSRPAVAEKFGMSTGQREAATEIVEKMEEPEIGNFAPSRRSDESRYRSSMIKEATKSSTSSVVRL